MRCWLLSPLILIARGVARLPQGVLLWLASVLSILLWPLLSRRRRIARINLDQCYPELSVSERRRLLRANQHATVMGMLELIRCWYAPASALVGLTSRIEGLPLLQEAMAQGRGVLLFTGHFTQTELAARLLGDALGKPIGGVIRRNDSECVESVINEARTRVGGPMLDKRNVRGLLAALRNGEALIYSADQDVAQQHAFVDFFGVHTATLTRTPDLARRGNALVLPFFFYRDGDGRYCLRVAPTWPGWMDASPEQAAAIYMRELEAIVRQHPEQYLWVHRRFKTRPPGEPAIY